MSVVPSLHATPRVTLAQGRSFEDQYTMLSTAHVVLDAGMVGVERIVLESVLCGLVATVGEFRAGNDRLDFPLPWALVFREDKGMPPLVDHAKVCVWSSLCGPASLVMCKHC